MWEPVKRQLILEWESDGKLYREEVCLEKNAEPASYS